MTLAKMILRVLAVAAREVVEVLRRPKALLGIIAGPILILGLFGLGYVGQPPLRTVLVIPPSSGLSADPAAYGAVARDRITVLGVTPDAPVADALLAAGTADLVVIAPPDAKDRLAAGEQAVLRIHYNTVSPYRAFIAQAAAEAIVAGVNRQVITTMARDLSTRAASNGVDIGVSPDLVAAPTRAEVADLAPSQPDLVAFYGLMVLALIVQHTVITVSALSVIHDRRLGMLDLFRISPISAGELLAGKYAAFTLLGSSVALITLGLLVGAFHVPFLTQPGVVVACLALLVMASIGIGSVVALRSDSDRQAIQVSLLILVASVFFSGLALDLNQFSLPVQVAGALLPVTQAGTVLQDLILRSAPLEMWRVGILGALAGGLFVLGWLMLRRQLMRPA
jgi:ABC-2 type transport system permease protein